MLPKEQHGDPTPACRRAIECPHRLLPASHCEKARHPRYQKVTPSQSTDA
jgi:hypothetical protein